MADDLAVAMHTRRDNQGNIELHTKVFDTSLARDIAGTSILAITASTIAFATALGWPYDQSVAEELKQDASRLADESN